ncbi:3-deoxy-D-arabinoheptulosonate-7-phosphate synthase [Micromonospora matsumotoense]|uniref:Phospho-2-dehydro-3-deoxyheptonate aldolase n=1 Tax=Micromonospora matsumotoense TaxID=121616 RepID=A0A1C5ARF4_9ACTN|nr:3-deoxy-7-phosphoheptulonate synthase [Micromonospora matsumotoense]SCF47641.1 3-deoxy-D-arabinoheptulosonate-7-phosphate synthase [Micromonospora matsumotoense]
MTATTTLTTLTGRSAAQQPHWPDPVALEEAERELTERPVLATEPEIVELTGGMDLVARGSALLLQGGDCAERFHEAVPELVRQKVDNLQGLAAIMRSGSGLPAVTIGRIAGQYGKPRSSPFETEETGSRRQMPSYCGDAVNEPEFEPVGRTPQPRRLLTAYECSRLVLDEVRRSWSQRPVLERVYTSHELLLLPYERPLVRLGAHGVYSGSTHFGWIGERTRAHDGAHVALSRAVHNPIGVKLGPSVSPDDAVALSRSLNPEGIPGRLTFIVRFGAKDVDRLLPPVVEAVHRHGSPAVWLCDPMHGNGLKINGQKTRLVERMHAEVESFVRTLRRHREWPAGLHLELTPDPVTECVSELAQPPRFTDFRSTCDPRLNPRQATEMVALFLSLL